ncbi:hypothetical protein BDN70DRAFT_921815 [Pholiota conissans]|uniref:KA1 domain-containing protein n=1 Tax=Pholiota conissans TaxID=109636 RepID=A0A9P5Z1K2_9AGAR|nr:hypothetical protein BDN70DRAFT_921815 [Pholiota conissans]
MPAVEDTTTTPEALTLPSNDGLNQAALTSATTADSDTGLTPGADAVDAADDADTDALGFHRGAIDQTTITAQPPGEVMKQVTVILFDMGLEIQKESAFKYRCVRPRKGASPLAAVASQELDIPDRASSPDLISPVVTHFQPPDFLMTPNGPPSILYGPPSEDSMDEVRFSVELTKLAGLKDTYSLDIRRLKGNLKSYGFIYNTIRGRAELSR